jgi:nucleotide-binding universal stress UspA family protein
MYRKILVGYDGSEGSNAALQKALVLAEKFKARLIALWAQGSLPHYPETVAEVDEETHAGKVFFRKISHHATMLAKKRRVHLACEHVEGHPAKALVKYAEEKKCDLIVLGHSGHSRLWGRLLGHTADRVSEYASCCVLIVRTKTSRKNR